MAEKDKKEANTKKDAKNCGCGCVADKK